EIAIRVESLSKRFTIGASKAPSEAFREQLVTALMARFRRKNRQALTRNSFWALRDINLDIRRGDVVALVGRNGAGKSTLLKILSRITEPTSGHADILRPDCRPAGSRHRFPCRVDGTRKHLPERRHPGNEAGGDSSQLRQHR